MSNMSGSSLILRNPDKEPSVEDLAAGYVITIVELDDTVRQEKMRTLVPVYQRELSIVMEIFVAGSSSTTASRECIAGLEAMKAALYAIPETWRKLGAVFKEVGYGRIMRPPVGNHVAGIGLELKITYTEDNTQLGG